MSRILIISIGIVCLLVGAISFAGSIPRQISYQGTVEDSGGGPVTDPVQIIFAIYDDEFTKAQLWAETLSVDPDANGAFTKVLGEVHEMRHSKTCAINQFCFNPPTIIRSRSRHRRRNVARKCSITLT